MIRFRFVKWLLLTRCGALLVAQKRVVCFLFSLLLLIELRHLTFLPFNPIIDPFFPDNVITERTSPQAVDPTGPYVTEYDYPIANPTSAPLNSATNANGKANKKLLLLWTDFFKTQDWELGIDISSGIYQLKAPNCSVPNCFLTRDRTMLLQASAVVFHFRNLQTYDLPNNRPSNQYWIFSLFESPEHTYSWHHITSRTSKRLLATDYKDFFNWTMSYRFDSDIPLFYGHFKRKHSHSISVNNDESAFSKKTRTAVTFISSCETASKRLEYIQEMQRYIDVDVIGHCSDSPHLADAYCLSKDKADECYKFVSATYKFYLAFENSLCGDYVTEKFFRASSLDLVPVVLNGALNMSKFAPPGSYIDADDFASPSDLAHHLENIGQNKELYEAHFWWKRYYDVDFAFRLDKAFCDTCAKLADLENAGNSEGKVYEDIETWWTKGVGQCRSGVISPNQTFRNIIDRMLLLLIISLITVVGAKLFGRLRCCKKKELRPT